MDKTPTPMSEEQFCRCKYPHRKWTPSGRDICTYCNLQIQYPIGGYAPGSYSCKCVTCKQDFMGDKRAVQCEPCAETLFKKTSMSEDTNTTQSAEEKLIEAMCITYCHEFGTLRDGPKTVMRTRMRQVLNNDIKPFWSEQLAQAKVPSEEEIEKFASEHLVTDENDTGSIWSCKKMGAEWFRSQVRPYITRIEQENAELKAMLEAKQRVCQHLNWKIRVDARKVCTDCWALLT